MFLRQEILREDIENQTTSSKWPTGREKLLLLNYNLHTDDDRKGNSGNATGTTRTTPAVEIKETEIPAITAMETATVRGRATIRRTASPGARMMQATAMQPMRRRTTARTSAAFSSRYRRKSARQRQIWSPGSRPPVRKRITSWSST